MSKNNTDVLLIGGLALAAVFMMGRTRTAAAAGTQGARPVRTTGGLPWGFTGLPTSRVIGAITGGSNSPDLVAGAVPGGSTGGFFSMIDAVDNSSAAVQSQYQSTLSGPVGLTGTGGNWLNAVGGAQSTFYLPDLVNPMQNAYAGFDNPDNYG
ncbi:hypothetical protein C6P96_08550 [Burkholderia multivorans]|uniref:hypothetical protein n=1 Tax=Burkholderia multivorans TaxID=87883 RepID=UPI000CFE90B0|nr:hypothetical protein [Burkholderia multivorans]PRE65499.1 hypothetical protein C6P95_14470 [Burkholderia multivorans]PRF15256.1 hypothetical protein C6P96_08550 [Burkholderia multivorans]